MPNALVLSAADREMIGVLRRHEVLVPLNGHRLNLDKGVILVSCSDGDQMPHIFDTKTEMFRVQGADPRIHTLALNGGALNIGATQAAQHFSEKMVMRGRVLLDDLAEARDMKDIHMVAIYTHLPCGIAQKYNLSLREQLDLLVRAKFHIKTGPAGMSVACFLHCDFGNDEKTIFFVSKEKWRQYCEATGYKPSWATLAPKEGDALAFSSNRR